MKPTVNRLVFCLILILVTPSLMAEWGGSLDQGFTFRTGETNTLSYTTTAAVGGTGTLRDRFNYGLSMSMTFSDDILEPDGPLPTPWFELFNVDAAYLNWAVTRGVIDPDNLIVTVGRFMLADPTGMVVATPADGFSLSLGYPRTSLDIGMGYTGLLWHSANSIAMSEQDVANSGDSDQIFGSPRLIGVASYLMPPLFQQSARLSVVFQEDMWSSDNVDFARPGDVFEKIGGPVDTQYFGLSVSGPVWMTLFHSTFFYFNTGRMLSFVENPGSDQDFIYEYSPIRAFLLGTSLRYYRPDFYRTTAAFRFLLASGDEDYSKFYEGNTAGNATQFLPITGTSLGAVFSPKLGNIGLTELSYSMRPLVDSDNWMFSTLQTVVRMIVFFRPTTGPVSEAGIVTGEGGSLLGTEINVSGNITPFPDLAVSSTVGFFFPLSVDNNGAFSEDYIDRNGRVQSLVRIQASLGL